MYTWFLPTKELAMTQSMMGFVVGLLALLAIGVIVVRRYRQDHPEQKFVQWLDAHHMGWMHHHKH
jgi:hypothetical protein